MNRGLGPVREAKNKQEKIRMTIPTEKEVGAIAVAAGVPVDREVAARIANSIRPALDAFAPIAGTLPFDLEPSAFVIVQISKVSR